jgi:ribA/ribD-fused uncharacterized protein
MKIIPFYSHRSGPYRCFSQFYKASFTIDGVTFNCAEQWMMYNKSIMFPGNSDITRAILECSDPTKIKSYGRSVRGYREEDWNRARYDIVVRGNYAKFTQNSDICDILLETGDATLVEASATDRIWGVGLSIDSPAVYNPDLWRGQNLLGKALMDVRTKIILISG